MYVVRFFVSHSFSEHHHVGGLAEFRTCVQNAVDIALQSRPGLAESILIQTYFEDRTIGESLPTRIRDNIIHADIFLIDISGDTANTFYELGYAHAMGTELLIVQRHDLDLPIPADIADLLVGRYESLNGLQQLLADRLLEIFSRFERHVVNGTLEPRQRCFWFPRDISEVHIVCAPEPERSRFASPSEHRYLFVDNLEDRDALMELSTFLSRAYPDARVLRHASDAVAPDILGSNLIVLGGPLNNNVARDFMKVLKLGLSYDFNEHRLLLRRGSELLELQVLLDEHGRVAKDVGYFGRFLNPFDKR